MLSMTVTREVKPNEIVNLVWGTGALSYPWWRGASLRRPVGKEMVLFAPAPAQPGDAILLTVDDPSHPEGSGRVRTKAVPLQKFADAASMAAVKGYIQGRDAINEDLGLCDATEADCVMQLAMFGNLVYG